jgi:hypothetical protein
MMTPTKTVEVAMNILDELDATFPQVGPQQQDIEVQTWTYIQSVAHYKYVALSIITLIEQKKYRKAQRWVGFLQCGLGPSQTLGLHSIRELGEMNMKKPRSS